jgi:hypothetical protein
MHIKEALCSPWYTGTCRAQLTTMDLHTTQPRIAVRQSHHNKKRCGSCCKSACVQVTLWALWVGNCSHQAAPQLLLPAPTQCKQQQVCMYNCSLSTLA